MHPESILNTMPGQAHKKECAECEVQIGITVEEIQNSRYFARAARPSTGGGAVIP